MDTRPLDVFCRDNGVTSYQNPIRALLVLESL